MEILRRLREIPGSLTALKMLISEVFLAKIII